MCVCNERVCVCGEYERSCVCGERECVCGTRAARHQPRAAICKTTLRCGDTLHVLVAGSPVELARMVADKTKRLLRPNGHAVVDASGRSVHIVDEESHPTEWHEDGNRVRTRRVRYERMADGSTTSAVVRTFWAEPQWTRE